MTAGSAGLAPTIDSECAKTAYRSKLWAEEAARAHNYDPGLCRKCRRGRRMVAYHCDGHWHAGHR